MILAYGLIFTGFGLLLAGLFLFLKWDAYNLILFSLGIQTKRQKELQEKIYKAKTSETSTSITSVTSTSSSARVSGVHPSDLEQAKPQFASVVSSKNANLKDNRLDIIARGENNIDEATLFEGELEEDSYTESTESSLTEGSSGSFNLDLGYTVNESVEEKGLRVGGYSLKGLRSAGADEYTDNVADDLTQVLVEDDLTQVLVEDEPVESSVSGTSGMSGVEIVMGDGESFALGGYAANKERLKKRKKKKRVSEPAPKVEDFIKGYRQSVSGSSEKSAIADEDSDLTEVLVEDNDMTEIIVDEGIDPNEAFTELTDSVMQEYMVNGDYGAELGRTSQEVENNDGYVPLKIRDTKPIEPEVSVTEVTEFFLDDEATEYEGTEFEDEDELTGRLDDDFEEELKGIRVLTEIVNTANIEDIKGEV